MIVQNNFNYSYYNKVSEVNLNGFFNFQKI